MLSKPENKGNVFDRPGEVFHCSDRKLAER